MTPTAPADATPAAGETLQDRLRLCAQHCQKLYETDEGSEATIQAAAWRLNEAANALDAFRAETEAVRAERDEANARGDRLARDLREMSYARGEMEKFMLVWWHRAQALEAEIADLKAKLAMAREALVLFSERIDAGSKYEDEEYPPRLFKAMIVARTTLAAIGELKS